ncbi:hypothetical protein BY996DRAFT_2127448 [Phakopsora pachyrhizi]|nr:hypothetical protein BY996DRAFT_2127448 [Phakopsora pachyrhizi]
MIKCLLSLLFIITFNESLTLGSFSKFFKGKPEEAINEVTDTVLQAKDQKVLKKSKSRITAVLPNSENLGEYITSKPKLDTVPTVTGKKERSSSSANFSQSIKKCKPSTALAVSIFFLALFDRETYFILFSHISHSITTKRNVDFGSIANYFSDKSWLLDLSG